MSDRNYITPDDDGGNLDEGVALAAAVLDEVWPDWVDRLPEDLNDIALERGDRCLLFYVAGAYLPGMSVVDARSGNNDLGDLFANDEWWPAWRRLIEDRRVAS